MGTVVFDGLAAGAGDGVVAAGADAGGAVAGADMVAGAEPGGWACIGRPAQVVAGREPATGLFEFGAGEGVAVAAGVVATPAGGAVVLGTP